MGLENVIKQIEHEGLIEQQRIEQEAKKDAEEILQTVKKKLKDRSTQKESELKGVVEKLRLQETSIAELQAKKIRLNAEKEILEQSYEKCLDALRSLPHKKILSALIKKAKVEMPEAVFIYANTRDEAVVRSLSNISFGGIIDCVGGVIVENKDHSVKGDYRYETLAVQVWNKSLKEIAQTLFR
ncbi:MAG: V-type ATP synthase subunit E family protein [Euryarchaeota archaeon]|nr:V-type ATP synthase subunit E family protein [Euryarchaeota archaeon]